MKLIDENSNMAVQGGTAAFLGIYLNQAYMEMLPWLIAAIPLIVGDLYFGIRKTKYLGQKVEYMKAISMTIDKTFGYVCWILISTTLSIAFHAEAIKFMIMGFVYLKEVVSCFRNNMQAKGIEVDEIEMFKILWKTGVKKGDETINDLDKVFKNKNDGKQ